MSLKINLPDNFGNGGVEHWSVIETNINWLNRTAHVVLAGWVNEKAKTDGKQPLDSKSFDYSGDNFPFTMEELNKADVNVVSIAYEAIKAPKIVVEEVAPVKEGDPVTTKEVDQNVFSKAVDI